MTNDPRSNWIAAALELYERPLIRYARWITGDLDQARETVQETFLKLCRQDPKRLESHLVQWLFTVCRNLALDARRKETRMVPLSDETADRHMRRLQGVESRTAAALDGIERQESLTQIQQIIDTLPLNQREVVYLKFQSELSYKEIAEVTQLTVTNVGFLLHTALKTIRQRLAEPAISIDGRSK